MHNKEVKVDLKVNRRESGLLQGDLAHLLGSTQPRVSRLERGKSVLTVEETVKLAIIFHKSTTGLFRLLSVRLRKELVEQIESMSGSASNAPDAEARQATLSRLASTLSANSAHYG